MTRTGNSRSTKPRRRGQALTEYVLILAFASIAVVAALGAYGTALADAFDNIVQQVNAL